MGAIIIVIFLMAWPLIVWQMFGSSEDDSLSKDEVRSVVQEAVGTQVSMAQPVAVADNGTVNQGDLDTMINNAVATEMASYIPTVTPIPPTPMPVPIAESVDDDPFTGPDDAKVVIVEFSDFQCGYCNRFYEETLPQILANYPNDVKFVYRDYPIFGEDSERAAMATECANDQGKFWEMHNRIFAIHQEAEPPALSADTLMSFAEEIGVEDMDTFQSCLDSQQYLQEMTSDREAAMTYGFRGTPGFLVNGIRVNGAMPYDYFESLIQEQLAAGS
jgi:protein-disulfide isomerase